MVTAEKTTRRRRLIVLTGLLLGLALGGYLFFGRGPAPPVPERAPEGPPAGAVVVTPAPPAAAVDPCREAAERLEGLFVYLDRQDYIVARKLPGGSAAHFKGILARLLASPPAVEREADDLLRVLQNRAHLFRVLGRQDLLLLREVLAREGERVESSFATLYQAMARQEGCPALAEGPRVTLQRIYPYAVFFLNTLGGTAYLMRQESRVRMLTQYYALLIVDQANRHRFNRLGLDIRRPLERLARDLEGAANLDRRAEYLETLRAIRARY